jgi:putative membrane protein
MVYKLFEKIDVNLDAMQGEKNTKEISEYYIDQQGNLKVKETLIERQPNYLKISMFLIGFVYLVGFVGLVSPIRNMFLPLSAINLIITAMVLASFHPKFNISFYLFTIFALLLGFLIEVAGVATGEIFGVYQYGESLGFKAWNVPIIIGVNWWMLSYASCQIAAKYFNNYWTKTAVASGLMILLDLFLEQVAIRNDFWSWQNDIIPLQNYIVWFFIAFIINMVYFRLIKNYVNPFGNFVYLLQLIFFILLNLFQP